MEFELVVQDNKSGKAWDISELVSGGINWETNMVSQPGKLTFEYIDQQDIRIHEGSPISFKVDNKGIFFGYVFKKDLSANKKFSITAYDQMRYLKNKDTYVFSGVTASEVFTKISSDFQLKSEVINASSYKLPPKVHDNKTLFEIIQYGIDETLINTGNWYIIRDNFGKLQFVNINTLKTDLFIGDESLLTNFNYSSSIDEDSYNQIKLIKENQETKKREVYIVKDSSTIKQWGLLQYFENINENANYAQIQSRADMLLKLKNRITRKLKLNAIGDLRVFAGSGIVLGISDLEKNGIASNQYFMVTQCEHTFTNNLHTMQLELQVSI